MNGWGEVMQGTRVHRIGRTLRPRGVTRFRSPFRLARNPCDDEQRPRCAVYTLRHDADETRARARIGSAWNWDWAAVGRSGERAVLGPRPRSKNVGGAWSRFVHHRSCERPCERTSGPEERSVLARASGARSTGATSFPCSITRQPLFSRVRALGSNCLRYRPCTQVPSTHTDTRWRQDRSPTEGIRSSRLGQSALAKQSCSEN